MRLSSYDAALVEAYETLSPQEVETKPPLTTFRACSPATEPASRV